MSKRMNQHQEREMFSPPEVAAKWGMSANTVLTLIHSKKLEAVPLNLTGSRPRWKVTRAAMDRFLEANSTRPVEASKGASVKPRKRHI